MGQTAESLRHDIEDKRAEMSGTLEAIGDRVSPGRIVERRRNRVVVWFRDAKDRVMGTADDMTSRIADRAHQAGDVPDSMVSGAKERTQGTPVVAGAIAFGVGALVGSVLPASHTERRLGDQALQAAEPLKTEVQAAGREVADHMRVPVHEAVEGVKETATQGAQEVKETATQGAQEVKETATLGAQEVKDTAQAGVSEVRQQAR